MTGNLPVTSPFDPVFETVLNIANFARRSPGGNRWKAVGVRRLRPCMCFWVKGFRLKYALPPQTVVYSQQQVSFPPRPYNGEFTEGST